MKQLHAADRIRDGELMPDAPVEECLQDRQVLVRRAARHLLRAFQFEFLDLLGCDLREMGLRSEVLFPKGKRRIDVAVVRAMLDFREVPVLLHCFGDGDVARGAFVPGPVLDLRVLARPEAQRFTLAAHAFAEA